MDKKFFKTLSFILLNILIVGCSSLPHAPTTTPVISWKQQQKNIKHFKTWHVKGKIGFTDGHHGGSASLDWQQQKENFILTLYGPFKIENILITGKPGNVSLATSNGIKLTANTPEEIIQQQLGWTVPVAGLMYWAKGIPIEGVPIEIIQLSKGNRLMELQQQGWNIEYNEYKTFGQLILPSKITLRYKTIKIKLIFKNWA